MSRKTNLILIFVILISIATVIFFVYSKFKQKPAVTFSGDSAYQFVVDQMQYGPRTPGSLAHKQVEDYIIQKLEDYGWQVETQKLTIEGHDVLNIIGKRGNSGEITLIGAHYDSRMVASEESSETLQSLPVPGAKDGASGVAVLLELARTLPELSGRQIWLVFF